MPHPSNARLAQLVERKALNLVVVGSSPTVGGEVLFLDFLPGWQVQKSFWEEYKPMRTVLRTLPLTLPLPQFVFVKHSINMDQYDNYLDI